LRSPKSAQRCSAGPYPRSSAAVGGSRQILRPGPGGLRLTSADRPAPTPKQKSPTPTKGGLKLPQPLPPPPHPTPHPPHPTHRRSAGRPAVTPHATDADLRQDWRRPRRGPWPTPPQSGLTVAASGQPVRAGSTRTAGSQPTRMMRGIRRVRFGDKEWGRGPAALDPGGGGVGGGGDLRPQQKNNPHPHPPPPTHTPTHTKPPSEQVSCRRSTRS